MALYQVGWGVGVSEWGGGMEEGVITCIDCTWACVQKGPAEQSGNDHVSGVFIEWGGGEGGGKMRALCERLSGLCTSACNQLPLSDGVVGARGRRGCIQCSWASVVTKPAEYSRLGNVTGALGPVYAGVR